MQKTIYLETHQRETLVDITAQVEQVVGESGVKQALAGDG